MLIDVPGENQPVEAGCWNRNESHREPLEAEDQGEPQHRGQSELESTGEMVRVEYSQIHSFWKPLIPPHGKHP